MKIIHTNLISDQNIDSFSEASTRPLSNFESSHGLLFFFLNLLSPLLTIAKKQILKIKNHRQAVALNLTFFTKVIIQN